MKYRKKPVTVEALQWTGANFVDMETFLGNPKNGTFLHNILYLSLSDGGMTRVVPGTWIVKGATGGYHPCPAHAFPDVYEAVEEPELMHHPV